MELVAMDVETANPNLASICAIGVAGFHDGELAFELSSLVDPQDWFSPMNVSIHGIEESMVAGAPTFPEVAALLFDALRGAIVACHTPFDRVAIHQACAAHGLDVPDVAWLDTARVARRAWTECAREGYGLASVCALIGYDFDQHDALEDAKAAGQVLLAASAVTGLSIEDWLVRVEQRITPRDRTDRSFAQEGTPEGPLAGEVIVFTGALRIPRREAAAAAANVGCDVTDGVNTKTTLLVVGDQDVTHLAGHDRSAKHRRAEELVGEGQPLRILRESDFLRLVELHA